MNFNFKERYEKTLYTLRHKKAFLVVEKQLRGKNTLHGYLHDLDKPFLYLAFWIDLKKVQKIHRKYSKHHVKNSLDKSKEDLIDTIIDWECARMTKPDKPLNAYQTLMKFYPEYQDTFLPIIEELLPEQIPSEPKNSLKSVTSCHRSYDNMVVQQKTQKHIKKQLTPMLLQQEFLTKKSR